MAHEDALWRVLLSYDRGLVFGEGEKGGYTYTVAYQPRPRREGRKPSQYREEIRGKAQAGP